MNELTLLGKLTADYKQQLQALLARESRRHQMDEHLPMDVSDIVKYELLHVVDSVLDSLECDFCDADLDYSPVTMAETHRDAHAQHIMMHS